MFESFEVFESLRTFEFFVSVKVAGECLSPLGVFESLRAFEFFVSVKVAGECLSPLGVFLPLPWDFPRSVLLF